MNAGVRRAMVRMGLVITMAMVLFGTLSAQDSRKNQPVWWFGGAIGPNFNFYSGDIRSLNSSFPSVPSFSSGSGIGVFLSPLLEYRPDPVWGGMLLLGFDGRGGGFDDVTKAGATYKLTAGVNYITLEPSLRITPFSAPLYLFAGPRVAFNVSKSFSYTDSAGAKTDGDWDNIRGSVFGVQIGAGYDIPLSGPDATSQVALSPFISFHAGQGPRSADSWSLSTLRIGLELKFGSAAEAKQMAEAQTEFSVRAPRMIPTARRVKETFPVRNYIFFDEGTNAIPERYIQLTAQQAASFKEEQLLQPEPKDLGGRSRRQMTVYHNLLNILGDRLRRYSSATIRLIGSSDEGAAVGKAHAELVKHYLTDVFGIADGRIVTEGREKPAIPSTLPGATRELDLVRPEDRRVEIASDTPEILDPVQIISLQEDPLDSDVLFSVPSAADNLSSWSIEMTDENGKTSHYGPFTADQERISGRTILGDRTEGKFTAALVAQTKSGQTVRKEETFRLAKSTEPEGAPGLRFSILFEFDQSKTVATYERFLTQTVAPLIPDNGSVVIHGHTDIIGEESHNLKLSRDRAEETMTVLQHELAREGKRGVKFDTYGFGEDVRRAPFDNRYPEERFYNRTVIIDIVLE
ncbi:MAG TPA: outer membrane beta-barrel protein [Bacteroidota bacterium]|nr:outer membrane beta-barrel protein [Bacteroidota bacterium]